MMLACTGLSTKQIPPGRVVSCTTHTTVNDKTIGVTPDMAQSGLYEQKDSKIPSHTKHV